MARIVVVSDSHLSPDAPHADQQWDAVVDEVRHRPPDLVVHAGDITLRGATERADLVHARRRLDELAVPYRAIAGNHDIGDVGETTEPVTDARRAAYTDVFGESNWIAELEGWRLVGVDIQTLVSSLPASRLLWEWLTDALGASGRTVLFIHRPLRPVSPTEIDEPRRYVAGVARDRLTSLIASNDTRMVVSGHVHQWRTIGDDACRHVWAPSTWASLPDSVQPRIGTKTTGVVEVELTASTSVRLVRPPALAELTIGVDFESPY